MQLEVALEADRGREGRLVEGLHRRQVLAIGLDLGQDRLPAAIAQLVVVCMDAEEGRRDRVVPHQPPEAGLDEVIEPVVKRTGVRRGIGPWQVEPGGLQGTGQTGLAPGHGSSASAALAVSCSDGRRDRLRGRIRQGEVRGVGKGVTRCRDHGVDIGGRHVVVGDRSNLTVGIFHHPHVPR